MKPSQTLLLANDPTFRLLATRGPDTEVRQAAWGGRRPRAVEPRVLCIMHRRLFIEHNHVFVYGF